MWNIPKKETHTIPTKIRPIAHNVPCPALSEIFVPQPFSPVAPFFTASKSDIMLTSKETKSVAQELDDTDHLSKDSKNQDYFIDLEASQNQYKSSPNAEHFTYQKNIL